MTGPMEPGRLHVVALGVGAYQRRELKYAGRDASSGQRGAARPRPRRDRQPRDEDLPPRQAT